ncbi:hypothetical protein [Sorangium atrum]|uniref:Secreted protein n=1 Tax=Sorangium atrum TaxID=2995308 RepID=A0ABT5CC22_9BACT|nr:hypothetical protein [Sorangium aterium]MDC0683937.1 hypothetical protein [Sorangium aterium]
MRSRTSSLVFVFCLAAGAAFAACSGETTENPGGDGGSGASGSAGTTSSTTGASTTGASTGSTTAASSGAGGDGGGGSDGGATVCDQACDKADECGFPVCDALPFDCADPAAECGAQCVVDATCEQLQSLEGDTVDPELAGCLSACQGGEGGSAVECLSCSTRNGCMDACGDDSACQLWLLCALGCMRDDPRPECFRSCDAAAEAGPGGEGVEALYRAVYECTCTSCADTCETIADPCSP